MLGSSAMFFKAVHNEGSDSLQAFLSMLFMMLCIKGGQPAWLQEPHANVFMQLRTI